MSNGVLGTRSILAGISQDVYVNNYSDAAIVTVNICNFNHVPTKISMAISTLGQAGITAGEWIEFDAELLGKGVLTRTGVAVSSGQYIVVKSSESNVSAQIWGIEIGALISGVTITANTSGDGPTFLGSSAFTVIAGDAS